MEPRSSRPGLTDRSTPTGGLHGARRRALIFTVILVAAALLTAAGAGALAAPATAAIVKPPVFESALQIHEPYDIAAWQSSSVWVGGSSDQGPVTGRDQFVIGWAL